MSRGAIFERLLSAHGLPVALRFGGQTIAASLRALIGRTDLTAETEEGTVHVGTAVDFLFLRSQFTSGDPAAAIVPRKGLEIVRVFDDAKHVYECLPRDDAPESQPIDPDRLLVRVHTRFQRTEPL
jgi:hypothetical protein